MNLGPRDGGENVALLRYQSRRNVAGTDSPKEYPDTTVLPIQALTLTLLQLGGAKVTSMVYSLCTSTPCLRKYGQNVVARTAKNR